MAVERKGSAGSLGGSTRVDGHDGAGNVAAAIAEQKFDRVRHVLDFCQPLQGATAGNPLAVGFAERVRHFGGDEARCDSIDCDSRSGRVLAVQRAGKPMSEALVAE